MFTMVTKVTLVTITIIVYSDTLFALVRMVSMETMVTVVTIVTLISLVAFVVVTMVTLVKRGIMSSWHDVQEMNAYRAGHVCLSIRRSVGVIQLENHSTDLDDLDFVRRLWD
jgi:hypothetical protein